MDTLTAYCQTCDVEAEVFGYWIGHDEDGRDQWELVPPPHHGRFCSQCRGLNHHDHDVSITGRA